MNRYLNNLREVFARIFRPNNRKATRTYLQRNISYWRRNSIYLDNIYNKISTDTAQMRFKHVKITRNQGGVDKMEWYENSDLANVLSVSPNPMEIPIVFWSNVTRAMLRDGVAVVVPRWENGRLIEIWLAKKTVTWTSESVELMLDDVAVELPLTDVWVFENPKLNVTAQLNQITELIDINLNALSEKLSEGNQSLRGFLKLPTKAADNQLKKLAEERVDSILNAAHKGGIGFLEQSEEFQELNKDYSTASKEELEFLKSQLYHAHGINEKLFTCDYSEEQYRAYYSSVMKLYQRVFSEEINRKYFTKTARTQGNKLLVFFDMADMISFKDLVEGGFKSKYAGLMNSNEFRETYLGLPGYEGGEVFETNLNAVQIGSESTE
ncbi:phage portal protein [Streptococcus orisratti]|uniref:phage portal protein n=1 Tax=Streptococcus orisratti TaxID=114652 RepID=UPI0029439AD5|nr:phage portal protein [Streptococcus orisratti]